MSISVLVLIGMFVLFVWFIYPYHYKFFSKDLGHPHGCLGASNIILKGVARYKTTKNAIKHKLYAYSLESVASDGLNSFVLNWYVEEHLKKPYQTTACLWFWYLISAFHQGNAFWNNVIMSHSCIIYTVTEKSTHECLSCCAPSLLPYLCQHCSVLIALFQTLLILIADPIIMVYHKHV